MVYSSSINDFYKINYGRYNLLEDILILLVKLLY